MRFSFYSLKTGILAYLILLIMSAMLLINAVILKFAERDLISARVKTGSLLLQALEQRLEHEAYENKKPTDIRGDTRLLDQITMLIKTGGFNEFILINKEGTSIFSVISSEVSGDEGEKSALKALKTEESVFNLHGVTWGVVWPAKKTFTVSRPIFFRGKPAGAASISASLSPIYQTLRKSEKVFLFYILMNTLILVLFGFFLFSRNVLNPIHKLLDIAETFKEGEDFPQLAHSSRNEIGRLYSSLNMMLKRLDENKKELKKHILELEKANREIKSTQREIIKSERLASVGRLATGLAHEIGNPIGIVLGYLELLKREDLDDQERKDFLERTESEITRISQIIRQLLDFSRPPNGLPSMTNLHMLIIEVLNMLKPQSIMSEIEVKTFFNASEDMVWADPGQIKQVLLNIIINSVDAMENVTHKKNLIIETSDNENFIKLIFADTGSGIKEQDITRIFDPFYTTKDPGKGTGLGLSICYRIIESLGGTIHAESPGGKGMRITIQIPVKKDDKENKE